MLKKLLLFIGFLSLSAGSARAQVQGETIASQQLKQRLRSQFITNDTAQAIISLYSRRQAGGVGWIVGAVLSAVRIGTASASTTSNYGGYAVQQDNGSNLGVSFLVATPLIAYGASKLVHYSNANLSRVLTDYGAGKPLPRSLRRKLKPHFFKQPIVKYKKVIAKPAN